MSLSSRNAFLNLIYYGVLWPFEYLLLKLVLLLVWPIPVAWVSAGFGGLLRIIGPLTPWHKRARLHIDIAFPTWEKTQKDQIAKNMWMNLGRTLGESFKMQQMLASGRLEFVGLEHMHRHNSGFIIGAHIGNWEAVALIGPRAGVRTAMTYRPLNNPYLAFFMKRRAKIAQAETYKKGSRAAKAMIEMMHKGGFMLLLADQKLREGEPVTFFGRPAHTAIIPFKIAAKTNKPIFFARTERLNGCQVRITISKPMKVHEKNVKQAAEKMNQMFETWIKQNPEQWMWPHRRWGKSPAMPTRSVPT